MIVGELGLRQHTKLTTAIKRLMGFAHTQPDTVMSAVLAKEILRNDTSGIRFSNISENEIVEEVLLRVIIVMFSARFQSLR